MSEILDNNAEKYESLLQSKMLAETVRLIGEEFGFDDETCDEIAELSFEEAIETTYGYLAQAGFDPDEVLADFIDVDL